MKTTFVQPPLDTIVTIRLPADLITQIDRLATAERNHRSTVVRRAVVLGLRTLNAEGVGR
jgi:predicted transcriptional regulator